MDPNKREISGLESLPQDFLGEIVSISGSTSAQDYHNCILSRKELGASLNDKRVCHKLNLAPLVEKPLAAKNYSTLMEKCLANNNPCSHYIKGIV